jgi:hypothetical protein
MTCKHQRALRIPLFPSDAMFCKDCGEELPRPGYDEHGIRDYYLTDEPEWRRRAEVLKVDWLEGRYPGSIYQCPECCFIGTDDDFDVMGADEGNLFCNQCGVEFEPLLGT